MSLKLSITPFEGELIQVPKIPRLFDILGEEVIRNFINIHYQYIKTSPIKHLFPVHNEKAFEKAIEHAADFIIQVSGGPDYFNQKRGNPMMRKRHMPFSITPKARIIWLGLYKKALKDVKIEDEILKQFWGYLDAFSMFMVNTPNQN